MLRERLQLGMHLRVVPVTPGHGGLEIVDHQPLGHAAKVRKGVLQTTDEGFRRLPPDDLAVGLAAVREHDAEDPRAANLAVRHAHGRSGAEVHLGLRACFRLHPPERQRSLPLQPGDESPHAVVAGGAFAMVPQQILVNPHGVEALLDLCQDLIPERRALAGRTARARTDRAGGRGTDRRLVRLVSARIISRIPGGRVWPVLGRGPGHVLANRLPIDAQKGRNLTIGVIGCMERKDLVDFGHRESVRHLGSPSAMNC